MSAWGQVTWDVARAGGFVAYGLLTIGVALGLALSMRWQTPRWPRLINSELHNFVTLLALIFTIIHVLAVWLDPFTAFGWTEVLVPMVSHYRPIWMAFGIIGLYLGLALAASVWLRRWIGYEWWRRLHVFTLVVYLFVTVHGLTTGSDTRTWWGIAIYTLSALLVAALLWIRLLAPAGPQQRSHPGWVAVTSLGLFLGVIGAMLGPMRSGWNALANAGGGSGQRGGLVANVQQKTVTSASTGKTTPTIQPAAPLKAPFSATVTGSLRENGPDERGVVTVVVTTTLTGGANGVMEVQLSGVPQDADGGTLLVSATRVTLGTDWNTPTYQGQLTNMASAGGRWQLEGVLNPVSGNTSGSPMDLTLVLNIDSASNVTGSVRATAYTPPPTNNSEGGEGDD